MSEEKVVLSTGVTGQDGSCLTDPSIGKGDEAHGIRCQASSFNTQRVDNIYRGPHAPQPDSYLHHGDLSDTTNLRRIAREVDSDEIYNTGARIHVAASVDAREYTADFDALGALRLLKTRRFVGTAKRIPFDQPSSSERHGLV